jgi:hypothetical protein
MRRYMKVFAASVFLLLSVTVAQPVMAAKAMRDISAILANSALVTVLFGRKVPSGYPPITPALTRALIWSTAWGIDTL